MVCSDNPGSHIAAVCNKEVYSFNEQRTSENIIFVINYFLLRNDIKTGVENESMCPCKNNIYVDSLSGDCG
jgi:hypothetical protein